ncbi:MAG TPA: SAM-dependent chlorinase/fluorinase [Solirubrobacteraceae bacterium]|nr:SAM-dependent chlorinase/fluorinase [Solirubrobacteraceae bacterium]
MDPPFITFLSDYGQLDEFVGVCHGVMLRRCPRARVIDLTHSIPRHDIRTGAAILRASLRYLPARVVLAVVDPGVGASGPLARRALAIRTAGEERLLVGPDNGLLMPAAELLGGAVEAVDIGRSRERLQPVSATFHGRDIFAPVAGALAAGEPLAAVGEPLAVDALRRLDLPSARLEGGVLNAHVLRCDGFGNVILDEVAGQLAELGASRGELLEVLHAGRAHAARFASTFADVKAGELLIYEDAWSMLALAVNLGSAAALLHAGRGEEITVRRR